jgi:outer membrane protein TolC
MLTIKRCLFLVCIMLMKISSMHAQSLTSDQISSLMKYDEELKADTSMDADLTNFQSSKLDLNRDLKDQLLPIDSIIDIAIRNNPGIKMQEALVRSGESQVMYAKREWLRNISFSFTNSYGNQTMFYNSNETPLEVQTQNMNTGYRAGININIPLYDLFGRPQRINIYKNELEAKEEQQRNLEMELARRVIYEYNYTIAAHKMMMISSENMQAALTHQAMADKEFSEGVIPIGESARITEFAAKAKMDFEIAKREFFLWYMQLETLLGVRMDTLIRTK